MSETWCATGSCRYGNSRLVMATPYHFHLSPPSLPPSLHSSIYLLISPLEHIVHESLQSFKASLTCSTAYISKQPNLQKLLSDVIAGSAHIDDIFPYYLNYTQEKYHSVIEATKHTPEVTLTSGELVLHHVLNSDRSCFLWIYFRFSRVTDGGILSETWCATGSCRDGISRLVVAHTLSLPLSPPSLPLSLPLSSLSLPPSLPTSLPLSLLPPSLPPFLYTSSFLH